MNDGDRVERDELVRDRLHLLAEDVEPRPDALPVLLAATRRRRRGRHIPLFAALTAATAVAVFFAVLVVVPGQRSAEPASIDPNSYVAQPSPGTVAEFDLGTGARGRQRAEVPGATGVLAADGEHAYAVSRAGGIGRIVQLGPDGIERTVPGTGDVRGRVSAAGGRIAFATGDAVAVLHGGTRATVPLPPGQRVRDLAVSQDGALAVLTTQRAGSAAELHVRPAEGGSWRSLPQASGCGPVAVSFSGPDVAALQPVSCSDPRLRVSTLRPEDGRIVGGGAVLPTRQPLEAGQAQLSTDASGRHLVSVPDHGQWLVDGSDVRSVPWPCTREGECASAPGVLPS